MAFSDRFAALYVKPIAGSELVNLLTSLTSKIGLSMTFPGTPSVTLLTENSEQRFVPLTEFQAIIQRSDQISCQFWWNDSEDLYCRVMRDEDGISIEFGLDGTSVEQEQKMAHALQQIFVMLASEGAAWGLVIDRFGVTAESSWKDIFLGRSPLGPHTQMRYCFP